ncbi:hypothetical protein [uncultured Aquimarina sp.]|uniref:hypothetical protein n=1 Tax=uncultured Aquimarina sp. TaxID=575652 RepID=UPI0026320152|nr:hypothetical protein [uncultured Aquimarina sp.]
MLEGSTSYCDLFVIFTNAMSSYERDVFRFQHRNATEGFGDFTSITSECGYIEIWRVDCTKLPREYDGGTVEGSTAVYKATNQEDELNDDDDNSPYDSLNPSNYIYLEGNFTDCVDVLERIIYESSF